MEFPITVPLVALKINKPILSDAEPTPAEGYEMLMLKDLTWTKLWIEFKIFTS